MKQRIFRVNNVTWTETDLAMLRDSFVSERKSLLALQFSGKATRDQLGRIQDLTKRINAADQLLAIGRAA